MTLCGRSEGLLVGRLIDLEWVGLADAFWMLHRSGLGADLLAVAAGCAGVERNVRARLEPFEDVKRW